MKRGRRDLIGFLFNSDPERMEGNNVHDYDEMEKSTDSAIQDDVPVFSKYRVSGNLVFVSGHGNRYEGDIRIHTEKVIKVIEGELKKAGSSLDKVLKVNVYLDNINDLQAMNEVFKGKFGKNPPVRTTVAVNGGLPPADAYIQMDCIAYK